MKYFSYDPNGDGFSFHDSADEAKEAAEKALGEERDSACNCGWNDNVTEICWGEIKEIVCVPYGDYELVPASSKENDDD